MSLKDLEEKWHTNTKLIEDLEKETRTIEELIYSERIEQYNKHLSTTASVHELQMVDMTLSEFKEKMEASHESKLDSFFEFFDLTNGNFTWYPFKNEMYRFGDFFAPNGVWNFSTFTSFFLVKLRDGIAFVPYSPRADYSRGIKYEYTNIVSPVIVPFLEEVLKDLQLQISTLQGLMDGSIVTGTDSKRLNKKLNRVETDEDNLRVYLMLQGRYCILFTPELYEKKQLNYLFRINDELVFIPRDDLSYTRTTFVRPVTEDILKQAEFQLLQLKKQETIIERVIKPFRIRSIIDPSLHEKYENQKKKSKHALDLGRH